MATPYFGNTLTDLQRGRTASEEIAGRIAMQQIIADAAREEARARAAEANQRNDLMRQQLAQQGQYQQGVLGYQNRAIDADAINRQARALFDQSQAQQEQAYRNQLLDLERSKLAANLFAPRGPEAAAEVRANAVAQQMAQEQALDSAAATNLAGLMNRQQSLAGETARLADLETQAKKIGGVMGWRNLPVKVPYTGDVKWWQMGPPSLAAAVSDKPINWRERDALFSQLPQGFGADPDQSLQENINRAKAMFATQTGNIQPLIQSAQQSGVGAYVSRDPSGMFTNTLPTTVTASAAPVSPRAPITPAQRQQILEFAARARTLGVPEDQINARIQQLLGQ